MYKMNTDCSMLDSALQQILIQRYFSKEKECKYTEYDLFLITLYIVQVMMYDEPLISDVWISVGIRPKRYNMFIYCVFSFLKVIDYNLHFDIYKIDNKEYIHDIYHNKIILI